MQRRAWTAVRGRVVGRKVAIVAGVVALATSLSGCTPAQPTVLTSTWETATGGNLERDGGYSAPLPNLPGLTGRSIWIWGDTLKNGFYVPGTFASTSPSTVSPFPQVDEVPTPKIGEGGADGPSILPTTPPRDIALFMANPTDLRLPGNAQPCLQGQTDPAQDIVSALPLRWPHGIARGPGGGAQITIGGTAYTAANLMFIAYTDNCLLGHSGVPTFTVAIERFGIAVYDPARNRMLAQAPIFGATPNGSNLPWQQWLYHPTFVGSDVYFYGVCNPDISLADACPDAIGKVAQAKVSFANVLNGAQYTWKTATGWSSTPADATTIVPVDATHQPWSVYVGDYGNVGRGWLMVEGISGDGDVRIYQAPSATGPWTLRTEGKLQGCPESPEDLMCYHLWGHPELSTTQDQIFSYHAHNPNSVDETYVISLGNLIPALP